MKPRMIERSLGENGNSYPSETSNRNCIPFRKDAKLDPDDTRGPSIGGPDLEKPFEPDKVRIFFYDRIPFISNPQPSAL